MLTPNSAQAAVETATEVITEVTLETDRLSLRLLQESDLDAYAEMCADPEVMRHIGVGMPISRAEAWRGMATILGHWQLRGYGLWAVEEKASRSLVGRVGCWYPADWPNFEVGWMLRRDYWGRGFAVEAARAAVQYAFEQLNRPHITSLIAPANQRSIAVAKRLGETLQGRTEVMGHEVLVYRLTRQDWLRHASQI